MPRIELLGNDFSPPSHLDETEFFSASILSNDFDNILHHSEQESNNLVFELVGLQSELPELREKLSHTKELLDKNRANVEGYEEAIHANMKEITTNDKLTEKIGSEVHEFKQKLLSILLTPLNEELIKLQRDESKLNSDKEALAEFLDLSIKVRDLCGKPLKAFFKALAYCEQGHEKQDFLKESEFLQKLAQSIKALQNKGEAIGLMVKEESEFLAGLVGDLLSTSKEDLLQEAYMEDMLSPIRELVHAVEVDFKRIYRGLLTIAFNIKELSERINSLKEGVLDLTANDLPTDINSNLSNLLKGLKAQGLLLSGEGEDPAESAEEDEYIIIDGLPRGVSSLGNLLKGLKAQKIAPNLTGEQQVELIKGKAPELIIDGLLTGINTSEVMNRLRDLKAHKMLLIREIRFSKLKLEESQRLVDKYTQEATSIEKYVAESEKKISKLKKRCQNWYNEPGVQINPILSSNIQHKPFGGLDFPYMIDSEEDFADYDQEIFRVIKEINSSISNERIEALQDLEEKLDNIVKALKEYWQRYGNNLSQKSTDLTELINQTGKLPEDTRKEVRSLRKEAFNFLDSAVDPLIAEILGLPIYKNFIAPRLSSSVQNSIQNNIYSLKDILATHKQTLSQLKREVNRISTSSLQDKEVENIEQSQGIEMIFGGQQHTLGGLLKKVTPSLMRQLSIEDVVRLEAENEIITSVIEYVSVSNTAASSDQENTALVISNYTERVIIERAATSQQLEVIKTDVGTITLKRLTSELSINYNVVAISQVSYGAVAEASVAVQSSHNANKVTQSKISAPVITTKSLPSEDVVTVNDTEVIFTEILDPEESEQATFSSSNKSATSEISEKERAKESVFTPKLDSYLTDIEETVKMVDFPMINSRVFASNQNTIHKESGKLGDAFLLSEPAKIKIFEAITLETSEKLFEEKPIGETRKAKLQAVVIKGKPLNDLGSQIKVATAEPEAFSLKNRVTSSTATQILNSYNYIIKYYYNFLRRRFKGKFKG